MVVDQSAEPFSQNSLIPLHAGTVHLDNLHMLGSILQRVHNEYPSSRLVLWKSDVSRAYRLAPIHPLWQVRQVVSFENNRYVNRRNNFGNRSGGHIWSCIFSLVLWIASILLIPDLLCYVDDVFSWDFENQRCWYAPYRRFLPSRQYMLLRLWDILGIPHEDRKQISGSPLPIIGFDVDPNAMTISMSTAARSELIKVIRKFACPGSRRPLRDFQSLAGWINWSLNVFPLLKPGLSALYAKIRGKTHPHRLVWVSLKVSRELLWIANHISHLPGILILNSTHWDPSMADLIFFSDACLSNVAFWTPNHNLGFYCPLNLIPTSSFPYHTRSEILFLEALAVVSALEHASNFSHHPSSAPLRVVVYTDSSNSVDIFDSLHAQPEYNPLLLTAVDLSLNSNIDFRILHIPGHLNNIADALSRQLFARAKSLVPDLTISMFTPPRLTLGAALS
jgi:hypothetical protein